MSIQVVNQDLDTSNSSKSTAKIVVNFLEGNTKTFRIHNVVHVLRSYYIKHLR
jgi:hypothetical protein